MNTNDLIAIVLLFIAVTDTFLAQTLLPAILKKETTLTPQQGRFIIRAVNATTLVFFIIALLVYFLQPL